MARVLMILTWLVSTITMTCAHYVDYAGAKMPQYGNGDYEMARDRDYRDHSPEASASLDYKYEEDTSRKTEKSVIKSIDNSEDWQKPSKKQKRPSRPLDDRNLNAMEKYVPEETGLKFKSNNRFTKRRPRLKSRSIERNVDRRFKNYVRMKNDDIDDFESKIDVFHVSEDFRNDKDDLYQIARNKHNFGDRDSTERIIRRKPRDRVLKNMADVDQDEEEDEINTSYRKGSARFESENYSENDERKHGRLNIRHRYPIRRPVQSNEDDMTFKTQKHYEEYKDYYDLRRLNNLKNKLPSLQRTTASEARPTLTTEDDWPTEILSARRFDGGGFSSLVPEIVSFTTEDATSTTTTMASTTKPTASTITTTQELTSISTTTKGSEDLSLAEKSRLSILKKAQRKESAKNETTTKKPPVLLQVTQKLHTVVMVEPPIKQDPWMRAREVSDDSPDRLERVKKLMRHKLVANAKNIKDLTDNWDDTVCDYVDLTLLENVAISINSIRFHFVILINILIWLF